MPKRNTKANKDDNPAKKTWTYCLNNYTDQEIEQFKKLDCNRHRCCKEVAPQTGTPHLQGAITFLRAYRETQLKKLFPRAHWEWALCTDPQNYCIKGEVIIDEKNGEQGKRSDLQAAIENMQSGGLIEVAEQHPVTFIKYHKGLMALQQKLAQKNREWIPTEVIVFVGPPGSGKSRQCREIDSNLYSVPEPINGTIWFDGYENEKTILLDDFYGWLKYHTLLQLTDGYPMQVPVKGSFVTRRWNKVLITSNKHPEEWYNREEIDALKRRITKIVTVTKVTEVILSPSLE